MWNISHHISHHILLGPFFFFICFFFLFPDEGLILGWVLGGRFWEVCVPVWDFMSLQSRTWRRRVMHNHQNQPSVHVWGLHTGDQSLCQAEGASHLAVRHYGHHLLNTCIHLVFLLRGKDKNEIIQRDPWSWCPWLYRIAAAAQLAFTLISIHGTEQHLQPPDRNTSVGIPRTPPGEPQLQQSVQIQRAKKMIQIEKTNKQTNSSTAAN